MDFSVELDKEKNAYNCYELLNFLCKEKNIDFIYLIQLVVWLKNNSNSMAPAAQMMVL